MLNDDTNLVPSDAGASGQPSEPSIPSGGADQSVDASTTSAGTTRPVTDRLNRVSVPTCVRRPRQRPKRVPKHLKGLPEDSDLEKLAKAYLDTQHKHWPERVADGTLPAITDPVVSAMVQDFKKRHSGGAVQITTPSLRKTNLAAAYLRYSCDQSSPRTLDDQLFNVLRKARDLDLWVPWELVFADAGLSGSDPFRQGYCSLKAAIQSRSDFVATLLDDFSRGGRNIPEWWVFATVSRRHRKNIVTADSSFDLGSPFGEMLLAVFAFFAKYFLTQLSGKVRRGNRGKFRRGGSVGRRALGYGMLPMLDAGGNPVVGSDGQVQNRWVIDPLTSKFVLRAGEMYGLEGASPDQIAEYFRENAVDGSTRWRAGSIRKLLWCEDYIGVEIYNRERTEVDPETGKRTRIENPRSEWDIVYDPANAIWSRELYKKVRRRLYQAGQKSPNFGKKRRRRDSDQVASFFQYVGQCQCGASLYAMRGGKHACLACLRGIVGLDCKMDTAKAAAIVEEGFLDYVLDHLVSPKQLMKIAVMTDVVVQREAAKPAEDTSRFEAERKELLRRQQNLIDLVAGGAATTDDGFAEVRATIQRLGKEAQALNAHISALQAEKRNLKRLTLTDVQGYLQNVRELLKDQPARAGEVLRALTGPVIVNHERHNDKKGGRWILTFTPNVSAALATQADDAGASTLHACGRELTHPPVRLVIDKRRSEQEKLAEKMLPFVGEVNPATGKPFSASDLAERFNKTVDLAFVAWRKARRQAAASSGQSRDSSSTAA